MKFGKYSRILLKNSYRISQIKDLMITSIVARKKFVPPINKKKKTRSNPPPSPPSPNQIRSINQNPQHHKSCINWSPRQWPTTKLLSIDRRHQRGRRNRASEGHRRVSVGRGYGHGRPGSSVIGQQRLRRTAPAGQEKRAGRGRRNQGSSPPQAHSQAHALLRAGETSHAEPGRGRSAR